MTLKYFSGCKTAEEVRKTYKTLAVKYHPDRGGDTTIMVEINAEYDEIVTYLKRGGSLGGETTGKDWQSMTKYRDVLQQIITIDADVEIIGTWIWVFNAYPYREILKKAGFRWASKRKAWIWHSPEDGCRGSKKKTIEEIRSTWGCEKIKTGAALLA